ncbi:MAG TPA: hypothetical protein VGE97_08865 [Nitrososphaera sp.]
MVRATLNKRMSAIEIPHRISKLPISPDGYPVPWFVQWFRDGKPCEPGEGVPDFRVMDSVKFRRAMQFRNCWVCGEQLGAYRTFVIGPMCIVNRTSAEPPVHFECGKFSVTACPFLTQPRMRRNEKDMPIDARNPAGEMIRRNPGVICLWITKKYTMIKDGDGYLFRIGDPTRTLWFAEGRPATREEIMHSIDTGYPILMKMAESEGDKAINQLERQKREAMQYVPT